MTGKEKTYRNLSIVLGLIAVVFVVLYLTDRSEPVSDTFSQTFNDVRTCKDNIAIWQQGVMSAGEVTAGDQAELNVILDNCKIAIETAQEKI